MELLGHRECIFSNLIDDTKQFSKVGYMVYTPTRMHDMLLFMHIFITLKFLSSHIFVIVSDGFNLYFLIINELGYSMFISLWDNLLWNYLSLLSF